MDNETKLSKPPILIGFAILLVVLVISLFGAKTPESSHYPVSGVQIGSFQNGISILQGFRGQFCTVSPFNDFYVTPSDIRYSFITYDEIKNKKFSASYGNKGPLKLINTALSYFLTPLPSAQFSSATASVDYETEVNGNAVTIGYVARLKDGQAKTAGITLSYPPSSFLFDSTYQLYDFQPQYLIDEYGGAFGIPLTPITGDLKPVIESNRLIVSNLYLSKTFVVYAPEGAQMIVNRDAKLIEISLPLNSPSDKFKTALQVEVYDTPKQALGAL